MMTHAPRVPRVVAASDRAFLVVFSDVIDVEAGRRVRRLAADLAAAPIAGTFDLHPAYGSVMVAFDPLRVDADRFEDELRCRAEAALPSAEEASRTLVVPVRYGGADGPDLDEVAAATRLAPAEVVARHAEATYVVAFVGFTPGFPYLAGLPEALATARRALPRPRVPAGSVAIAGRQAGVYPVASPGGWNLIGRTTLPLFDAAASPPARLAPGDRVRFVVESGP